MNSYVDKYMQQHNDSDDDCYIPAVTMRETITKGLGLTLTLTKTLKGQVQGFIPKV